MTNTKLAPAGGPASATTAPAGAPLVDDLTLCARCGHRAGDHRGGPNGETCESIWCDCLRFEPEPDDTQSDSLAGLLGLAAVAVATVAAAVLFLWWVSKP